MPNPPETPGSQRLTNDDFRKLLMTPRSAPSSSTPAPVGSIREAMAAGGSIGSTAEGSTPGAPGGQMLPPKTEDKSEERRKKKSFYAKLKKQEDTKMAELAEKYRDRASERRQGANPDYLSEDPLNSTAQAYRAVAPDLKSGFDAAERRRQMIQESKFLGGDMEHTHLVKGLDYALLQKVRSEITQKEYEEEQELERLATKSMEEKEKKDVMKREEDEMVFRTKVGKAIYQTVCVLRGRHVERSEMFAPGRMAYVIDLDEDTETDIPTTLIRSKADIPTLESATTLSTNDIVINKLTQILSYLRQGSRKGRKGRATLTTRGTALLKDLENTTNNKSHQSTQPKQSSNNNNNNPEDSIYGDIGDYVATRATAVAQQLETSTAAKARDKSLKYFEKSAEEENTNLHNLVDNEAPQALMAKMNATRSAQILNRIQQEPEGYAECYPGLEEMNDAIDDSDDEVDYSKMDLGNKKGPIGRWDFDTAEEYSDYMNQKEALPKAAFQYGVKMADGRRSRKHKDKNEKAHLDREWQKIQNIIHKVGPSDAKKAKY